MMLRRNQTWINFKSPALDGKVVEAALEWNATHLDDAHTTTFCAVVYSRLLQQHDPVRNGVELQVILVSSKIIQEHDGGPATRKEMLKRQDLPPIAQRALCQQA